MKFKVSILAILGFLVYRYLLWSGNRYHGWAGRASAGGRLYRVSQF